MHPTDCPSFDYSKNPNRSQVLADRSGATIRALRAKKIDGLNLATDSREVHKYLFAELAPAGFEYFAGHYRGEDFRCLKYYAVAIKSDPSVGFPPHMVRGFMSELADSIRESVAALDAAHLLPNSHHSEKEKMYYTVVVASRVLELFLRIHPYADGNGHSGRFIVWALLGRHEYWPQNWPIEPRPPHPGYLQGLVDYRAGNPMTLESCILQSIAGP